MLFSQLLRIITGTTGATPTLKKLKSSGTPIILQKSIGNSVLTIYQDGYVSYSKVAGGKRRYTVFAADRIVWKYKFVTGGQFIVPPSAYANLPATSVLTMYAEQRLSHNVDSSEEYKIKFHLNNDGTDFSQEASIPDFADSLIDDAEMMITNRRLYDALSHLTDKQREVVTLYYFANLTQDEIAGRLHISRSSVESRLNGALKKLKKYF